MAQVDAALSVDLDVGVEVDVAERAGYAARGAVLILVAVDAGLVVGDADARGDTFAVVGG